MEWICREWAGYIADGLSEECGQCRIALIISAEERLRHSAGTLGQECVYEILVDQARQIAGADGLRRFDEFWNGFESLDPQRRNPETPPLTAWGLSTDQAGAQVIQKNHHNRTLRRADATFEKRLWR